MAKFISSEKGKRRLVHNNFIFYVESEVKDKKLIRWKCSDYQKKKCRARLTMVNDEITIPCTQHNHVADVATVEAAVLVENIRQKALESRDKPRYVLQITLGT